MNGVTLRRLADSGLGDATIRELTLDELDAVNGGGKIGDFIDHLILLYRFHTGTIKNIATELP